MDVLKRLMCSCGRADNTDLFLLIFDNELMVSRQPCLIPQCVVLRCVCRQVGVLRSTRLADIGVVVSWTWTCLAVELQSPGGQLAEVSAFVRLGGFAVRLGKTNDSSCNMPGGEITRNLTLRKIAI